MDKTEQPDQITQTKIISEITIAEREDMTTGAYITPTTQEIAAPNHTSMPTDECTAAEVLKTPVLIDSSTWDTTQAVGTEIKYLIFPDVFASLLNYHKQILSIYTFFRPIFRVHLQINSTKFHAGKLIAAWDPMAGLVEAATLDTKVRPLNIYSASGNPHVLLDAGYSNSATFDIPFEHLVSYLTTNSQNRSPPIGILHILVLNQLQATDNTTTSLTVNTTISCVDVDLHLPIIPHQISFEPPPAIVQNMGKSNPPKRTFWNQLGDTFNSGKRLFGNIATGNFKAGLRDVGDTWNSVLDLLGLDKPNYADTKIKNQLAFVSPLTHMIGSDAVVRLSAEPTGAYTTDYFSAAPLEELKISNIIQTPMMYDQIPWNGSQVTGTRLFRIPLNPVIGKQNPGGWTSSNDSFQLTFMGQMAQYFSYWHGSMTFRFDFAATQFHTGSLIFVYEPNSVTTVPAGQPMNLLTSNPHLIFDLHEHKTVEFTFPFTSPTPAKRMFNRPYLVGDDLEDDLYVLGWLSCFVYIPLARPSDANPAIMFNAFAKAGPDMVYEMPVFNPYCTFITPPSPEIIQQGGFDALPTRELNTTPCNLFLKGGTMIDVQSRFDETIDDVISLMKRYTFLGQQTLTLTDNKANYNNYVPAIIGNASTSFATDFISGISGMFTFWSGSFRLKIAPYTTRVTNLQIKAALGLPLTPSTTDHNKLTGYPNLITLVSQDAAMELEIPFYSPYHQCLITYPSILPTVYDDYLFRTGRLFLEFETGDDTVTPAPTQIKFDTYTSVGDDFRVRLLVSPPIAYIPASTPIVDPTVS